MLCVCLVPQVGRWCHHDDRHVAPVSQPAVLAGCHGDGYLFCYVNTAISTASGSSDG